MASNGTIVHACDHCEHNAQRQACCSAKLAALAAVASDKHTVQFVGGLLSYPAATAFACGCSPPSMPLPPSLLILAAVIDAHQDPELDELVELPQGDAPHAGQLRRGFALRLRVVAPATTDTNQCSGCQRLAPGMRALTKA